MTAPENSGENTGAAEPTRALTARLDENARRVLAGLWPFWSEEVRAAVNALDSSLAWTLVVRVAVPLAHHDGVEAAAERIAASFTSPPLQGYAAGSALAAAYREVLAERGPAVSRRAIPRAPQYRHRRRPHP